MDNLVDLRRRYLDLMKQVLVGMFDEDIPSLAFPIFGFVVRQPERFVRQLREHGRDLPSRALSSIGMRRMDNLQVCIEQVLADGVPGDLIETGVWRGGACIFMRAVLAAYGVADRVVWVADSFEGLPAPDPHVPVDAVWKESAGRLAVSIEEVRANFSRHGFLDEQVRFLQGWFKDTLPVAPIGRLAVLRLDGDLYQSTMDALTNLYPKLSPGGYVIVDDHNVVSCRQAVEDYRRTHAIDEPIIEIDGWAVYWRRSKASRRS
jgi:hypothetical protein